MGGLVRRALRAMPLLTATGLAVVMAWWVVVTGPRTAARIVAHNRSGIDDARLFPQRQLVAASPSSPFGGEGRGRFQDSLVVDLGEHGRVPLAKVLDVTDSVALVVIKDNALHFEAYAEGYQRGSLSFSVAKSVLSLLVGMAIDDGYIRSVEQAVTDFIPELATRGFDSVTLRHLLQMTSGVAYAENDNPFGLHPRFYYTDQLEREILGLRIEEEPGRRFKYKSGDALLLGLVLKRALRGESISAYTQRRLWSQLGMEFDGSWSIDSDAGGLEKVACCLTIAARDLAKIGQLYLNRGLWANRRLVSEEWTNAPTERDQGIGSSPVYQRMWWTVAPDRPDFVATGHLGQFLYVNPTTGVVVVRQGRSLGGLSSTQWVQVLGALSDRVE